MMADNAPEKIEHRRRFQVVLAHFTYHFIEVDEHLFGLFQAGINGRPWSGIRTLVIIMNYTPKSVGV